MALIKDENTLTEPVNLGSVPWIQISQRLGLNSTKVNGFYKYKGKTNSQRGCYLKHRTDDCWIYFQNSKTQGNVWFIGDPSKGNYAYVLEDLEIPVEPTKPLHIWNGKEFAEDPMVKMQVYNPENDSDPGIIKQKLLEKLRNLEKVKDYSHGEIIFGTLKEHIEYSRPTMDIHYDSLMDGVIDRMFQMLETDVDAIRKTLYKFLGLFIYYFKELKYVNKKRDISLWCNKIFSHCLPNMNLWFVANGMDVALKSQVLVNATLVLRNSMEFITDVSAKNSELLIPIIRACVHGMTSTSENFSQTDREIFSGLVYMAALFDHINQFISRSDAVIAAGRLMNQKQTSPSFSLKLSRLIISLSGAEHNPSIQIEPLINALKLSMEGKPPAHSIGDLRWVLWHTCFLVKCLAYNDANKVELINLGVVEACIEIIATEYDGQDLYLIPNRENRIQAFGILEHLSFASNFRSRCLVNKFQVVQDRFRDNEMLGPCVARILWNLHKDPSKIKKSERAPTGPILICFSRADDEARTRVVNIVEEKSNFSGVLNEFQDMPSMMQGVDQASVILLGLSPNLAKSAKTRIEVEYAIASGKPIMALNIAFSDYSARMSGWLAKFFNCAIDVTNHDKLPHAIENILNSITEDIRRSSDVITNQYLPSNRESEYNARGISPLLEVPQSAGENSWSSVEEIYRWLRNVVHLEDRYIDRFRKSQITFEGYIHLSYLATQSFPDFNELLSQHDFMFPGGIILHLAHFFMKVFKARQALPYSVGRDERKESGYGPTLMVSRRV